ncbi:MAG: hypothetical protein R2834_01150 [Rhodothermales bacterium]
MKIIYRSLSPLILLLLLINGDSNAQQFGGIIESGFGVQTGFRKLTGDASIVRYQVAMGLVYRPWVEFGLSTFVSPNDFGSEIVGFGPNVTFYPLRESSGSPLTLGIGASYDHVLRPAAVNGAELQRNHVMLNGIAIRTFDATDWLSLVPQAELLFLRAHAELDGPTGSIETSESEIGASVGFNLVARPAKNVSILLGWKYYLGKELFSDTVEFPVSILISY